MDGRTATPGPCSPSDCATVVRHMSAAPFPGRETYLASGTAAGFGGVLCHSTKLRTKPLLSFCSSSPFHLSPLLSSFLSAAVHPVFLSSLIILHANVTSSRSSFHMSFLLSCSSLHLFHASHILLSVLLLYFLSVVAICPFLCCIFNVQTDLTKSN